MPNTATMIAVPMPPKTRRCDLGLAAEREAIAARPVDGVETPHDFLGDASVLRPRSTRLVIVTARCWLWCVISVGARSKPGRELGQRHHRPGGARARGCGAAGQLARAPAGKRTMMGYSSPSGARKCRPPARPHPGAPCGRARPLARQQPGLLPVDASRRSVRGTVSGLARRVPGVPAISCSTRRPGRPARRDLSIAHGDRRRIGGPFSNSRTSMRAPDSGQPARSESSISGVAAGCRTSAARTTGRSWPTPALGDAL